MILRQFANCLAVLDGYSEFRHALIADEIRDSASEQEFAKRLFDG